MNQEILAQLAPDGVLRAGINLGNFLLVTGRGPAGEPQGVSPDMAAFIAGKLGVKLELVPYPRPAALADDAGSGKWAIGLIGAEPQRAETIAFTDAYAEIEATYLVPPGSPITGLAQVDQAGHRIAVAGGAAYDLWLDRNIKAAELIRGPSIDAAFEMFRDRKLEVLAGLRPRLIDDAAAIPGSRILEGRFMSVQQAVGTPRANVAAAAFLAECVLEAKASGLVAELIAKHGVQGLSVAK
ncbi:transporter substrate-binding domain-containing protein [Rhodovarius crocodyli]|uniref:Transporter substrate-binding domain-containing protein n=1 Tax=Rhodovarius crocodyli TaxID=1979269 RepID=A0A437M3F5_9PROT|nr:transporter substrate-binding domain-containing protein [Rhodovarius crocodyli]RVT92237.1 transporter substrate-binding domain-containing protein [Rhodovarius crocodyli]